ncbi:TIGR04255 family protein [Iningainema tapete]|uniref:TIGR04255 family protein n=1 Tax=Iningainema tapete BLCC-T55 TaxID=2748662 RepID=A0A8J6XDT3_9CYAN|nr:TIGR04255 family protein [Iningainema tapete]MBD2774320.1 TIGR04255 family protein [Iningainema tapete BLCC-T55]
MGEPLRLAPLVEALCEFRFTPSVNTSGWDMTLPGRLYERIRQEFPNRSQVSEVGIQFQSQPNSNTLSQVFQGVERLQLKRSDESAMVQIGQNTLIVNQLKYHTWDDFCKLINRILSEYVNLLDNQFILNKIGLRYINHIPAPSNKPFEISDFLSVVPNLTGELNRPLSSFYQQYGLEYTKEKSVLNLQALIAEKPNSELVIILDLDFSSEHVGGFSNIHEVTKWLEQAHENIELAFISSLNPKYYESIQ